MDLSAVSELHLQGLTVYKPTGDDSVTQTETAAVYAKPAVSWSMTRCSTARTETCRLVFWDQQHWKSASW